MDFFPRRAAEVTRAVLFIAYETEARLDARAVPAPMILKHIGAEKRHLETTLQSFVHAGILKARRGPAGGYLLGRPADTISVLDLIDALPTEAEEKALPMIPRRAALAADRYSKELASITIASLLKDMEQEAA
jgi:DNA-binding IscR family transcriptional regulator